MHQPVRWLPWGPEAFARAVAEDKPILLDVGAVWCQWCHVMSRESYSDAETAELINEHFVAIKVDRDERPELDARYQAAVSAISGQGGWPLTVFLTPAGLPYFGGTYFPAAERYGQPSFQRVLRTMAGSFYGQRNDVEETASSVLEAIEVNESYAAAPGNLRDAAAARQLRHLLVQAALQQFDPQHGGFGSQPKFPNTPALDLLMQAARDGSVDAGKARDAALITLHAMSRGGICDQLAGGFHRYSTDARWVLPRFEKMLYDNAALLATYARAAEQFADVECGEAAMTLLEWMSAMLYDQDHAGFFSLQNGEVDDGDTGRYYTWTHAEAAAVLAEEELRFAEVYFDLGPVGDVPTDPTRNVLFRAYSLSEAARRLGLDKETAQTLATQCRDKLLAARLQRVAPPISRAKYTAWNAMAISAFVAAARSLHHAGALASAQRTLDTVLTTVFDRGFVQHGLEQEHAEAPAAGTRLLLLDDHVLLAHSCMDMAEATGNERYLQQAAEIADVLLRHFQNAERGGFFDTPTSEADTLGVLAARRKPVQDAFTPAGNSMAASLLLRLHRSTGDGRYFEAARETLECFAAVVEHLGIYAASFGLALAQLAEAQATTLRSTSERVDGTA